MIKTYIIDQLFEINKNYDIVSFDDDILIVDNWYKNYDDIMDILLNSPVSRWKWVEGSRNFIDYYDCRSVLPTFFYQDDNIKKNIQNYSDLIYRYYGVESSNILTELYEFNFYKNIKKDVKNNLQHHPHRDYDITSIIYLDEICSGGTSIYEIDSLLANKEEINLLYDITDLKKNVIQSKPNRMIMFHGQKYHGGYIEDHNRYIDEWRINQVLFFKRA